MGFLKRFLQARDPADEPTGFERLSEEELDAHMGIARYGDFVLTDAIRPSYDLKIVPTQGYRHDVYEDEENRSSTPVLMAAVTNTRQKLFEVFMALLDPLGKIADVALDTSHQNQSSRTDLYREHIDMPVLKSILWEFQDLLTHDGRAGIAVMNPDVPQEVRFDEHKLIIVYGDELAAYEEIFATQRIPFREKIKFIAEAEHVHSSFDAHARQFEELSVRLGMDR